MSIRVCTVTIYTIFLRGSCFQFVCLVFSCGSTLLFFALFWSPQSTLYFPPWSSFYGAYLQSCLAYWMLGPYAPIPKKQESLSRWCLPSWSSLAPLLWTGAPKRRHRASQSLLPSEGLTRCHHLWVGRSVLSRQTQPTLVVNFLVREQGAVDFCRLCPPRLCHFATAAHTDQGIFLLQQEPKAHSKWDARYKGTTEETFSQLSFSEDIWSWRRK